jgi:endonuclease/exonuclease/phosphatase (EEP) superfamily protein YafD
VSAAARIVVWNILSHDGASNRAIELLLRQHADVAILIEFSQRNRGLLPAFKDHFPYQQALSFGSYGIAVVSRWPMDAVIPRVRAADNLPFAEASIAVPHWPQPLQVIGIHTLPPIRPSAWEIDRRYIDAIIKRSAELPDPLIVAGDWNATPTSDLLQQVTATSDLRRVGSWWQPTWGVFQLPLLQIDHAYVRGLAVHDFAIGAFGGSDHRPLLITVSPEASSIK